LSANTALTAFANEYINYPLTLWHRFWKNVGKKWGIRWQSPFRSIFQSPLSTCL